MLAVPFSSLIVDLHPSDARGPADEPEPRCHVAPAANVSEAALGEAYERGRAHGLQEIQAELARVRSELEATHRRREVEVISALRAELKSHIDRALEQLVTTTDQHLVRILKPFLVTRISEEAIEALLSEVETILQEAKSRVSGHVRGPQAMIELLRPLLETYGNDFKFDTADLTDIQIRIGEVWLETRIGEWLRTFEAAA